MSIKNLSAVTLLFLAAFSAHAAGAAAGPAAGAGRFYCCEGRRFCGDSLPEQCRGKAYRIYDSKGNFLRDVGPPMSADEKAACSTTRILCRVLIPRPSAARSSKNDTT